MQRNALCRSRRELSNAYLLGKIGFDTAENEPLEVWGKIQLNIHLPPWSLHVAPPSPPASPSPPPCLTKPWAPCGGSGKPTACCPDGYTCLARSPAFSQCAPATGPIGAALRRIYLRIRPDFHLTI